MNYTKSDALRFYHKVSCSDEHWLWTGSLSDGRYGQFWANGRHIKAHRFAWQLLIGPLHWRDELHHQCGVTTCVKPWHLEKTNHQGNMAYERRDTCKNGHLISEVGRTKAGNCRQCNREYQLAWYHKNKRYQ